jgi:two-component system, NarL family, nitrate/nitrite response regulator NarL
MECQLMADVIRRNGRVRIVSCATNQSGVLSAVQTSRPNVAVISARLQDGELAGIRLVRDLRVLQPSLRTIIVLDADEREQVVLAFRNGARGIFCRSESPKDLSRCIHKVHEGQIWANGAQTDYLVDALIKSPAPKVMHRRDSVVLGKRARQVCQLAATGLSNREISARLGLSEHTVKNYLSQIFEKLRISTRTELVLYTISQSKEPKSVEEDEPIARSQDFAS